MALTLDTLTAGQNFKFSILKRPRSAGGVKTLERLMRMDATTVRGLRKAQHKRMQGLVVYNRGNRDWTKREPCGKLVRVEKGQSWTLCYSVNLAGDLASVADYLSIEKA